MKKKKTTGPPPPPAPPALDLRELRAERARLEQLRERTWADLNQMIGAARQLDALILRLES